MNYSAFTFVGRASQLTCCVTRPGSGCTTLLKVLSNNTESYKSVEGEISYDGATPKEMGRRAAGDICYLPEVSPSFSTLF